MFPNCVSPAQHQVLLYSWCAARV